MNIADFQALDDWEKLVVVEIEVGRKLQEENWEGVAGKPNLYKLVLSDDGEIVRVEEDGSEYTEKFSTTDCNGAASTFYYDDLNKTLYVHTSGSDDPATLDGGDPKYNIVAFFWEFFSNRPKQLQPYEDILKEANGSLEFWTTATDAEEWTEVVVAGSTVTKETTETFDGKSYASCKLTADAGNNDCYIHRLEYLKPKRKAKIRLKHKESTSGKTIRFVIRDQASNVYLNTSGEWVAGWQQYTIPNATEWTNWEFEFITHPDYNQYQILIMNAALASASSYVDNIEVWRYRQAVDCHAFLPQNAIPSVEQSVGDYYQPDERIAFGVTQINNVDGWFYSRRLENNYLWHGRDIRLRVGKIDEDYEDLALFFTGVTRKPVWGNVVEIGVKDERVLFQRIPLTRFNSTDYPNVEDAYANKPVPIALGMAKDIPLPQSNTATKTFKISETSHGGATYDLVEVTNVYKNGVLLATPGDYTIDLPNGEITLVCAWAAGDVITANVSGIDIDFWDDPNEVFYPANWLYFLYAVLNGVSKYRLDIASLVAMNAERKLGIAKWILNETDSLDFLIEIKKSAIIQTYIGLDGMVHFIYYTADVASGAPHYYNEDYIDKPRFEEDTDQTFKEVVVRSRYMYNDGYYFYEDGSSEDQTGWNHHEKTRLVFDTLITLQAQARDLVGNFASMVKDPIEVMEVTLPSSALLLNPTDKIYISYSEKDDDENEIPIYDDEVFRILSLDKDLNTGHVRVRAIKDVSDFFWTIT